MKKQYIKITLFLFLILGSFFCFKSVKASDQISIDASYLVCVWYTQGQNFNNGYTSNFFRQSFNANHTNLSKITLKKGFYYGYLESPRQVGLAIWNIDTSPYTLVMATTTIQYTDGVRGGEFDLELPVPVHLNVGTNYAFAFQQAGNCNSPDYSCFNVYTTLDNEGCYDSGSFSYGTDRDLWFKIWYDDTLPSSNHLIQTYPYKYAENLVGTNLNFRSTYNSDGTYDNIRYEILKYASSSQATFYRYLYASTTIGTNLNSATTTNLDGGNYAWSAEFYNSATGNTFNDSGVLIFWNFSVQNANGTNVPLIVDRMVVSSTTAGTIGSDKVVVWCDMTSTSTPEVWYGWLAKWITDGFRDVMCTTLIPNKYEFDRLASSTEFLITQAPLGYLPLAYNSFVNLASSTGTSTAPGALTDDNYTILKSISELTLFDYIKEFFNFLIIVLGIIYLYKRIKILIKI